ncbi:MAG: non-ribosomal peptide synthetase, partial [bacterium]|nr:non-ribosomal peptide synthetase [bacterium]
ARDLFQLYREHKKLHLPLKTGSFKHWSETLSRYAHSPKLLQEKTYWRQLLAKTKTLPCIKRDFAGGENRVKDMRRLSFALNEEETGLLLTRANESFSTEVNDLLLTALGLAIRDTMGLDKVVVALEGHGREQGVLAIDVSRTVGWFTSVYPVLLDLSYGAAPGQDPDHILARQVKEVKESLRRVPNKGTGYG